MKVLVDYHHADLYESLAMLFEDRFGWELYRPYGLEWWDDGYWNYERHMPHGRDIAAQYLSPWGSDKDLGDHFERDDESHPGRILKLLTLEQALEVDIVIASLTENEEGFHRFAKSIGAKFGLQLGNQGTVNRYDLADFSLFSTTREYTPWTPFVFYRQEFSLKDFRFEYPPTESDVAATWVQCLPSAGEDWDRFTSLAKATPELRWFHHGHCNQDSGYWRSNVRTTPELAAQMRAARIGIHFKQWSDGYGHVIHNLFAVGKPVVATASYYADKLAAPLFVDGETSFDVQTRSKDEVVAILHRLASDDDFHRRISENAAARFSEVVDFDADADAIRAMFEKVL